MTASKLNRQALGLLLAYLVQFIAGMILNLFVEIPYHAGSNGKNYFISSIHGLAWALSGSGGLALAFHVYLAIALVIGSLGLLFSSFSAKSKLWTWCSSIALLSTIGAFFNGLSYINYAHNFSSMIMAICWLVAVGSIIYGLVIGLQSTRSTR